MGRLCFSMVLLLFIFFSLLFSNGFGRKMADASVREEHMHDFDSTDFEQGKSREMMELDYVYAGPNTNSQSGYLFASPPPPQPAPALGF